MARGEAERASTSSAMRLASALQHSKCREFEPSAQGRYWMARRGYLFSVALTLDLTFTHAAARASDGDSGHSRLATINGQ